MVDGIQRLFDWVVVVVVVFAHFFADGFFLEVGIVLRREKEGDGLADLTWMGLFCFGADGIYFWIKEKESMVYRMLSTGLHFGLFVHFHSPYCGEDAEGDYD